MQDFTLNKGMDYLNHYFKEEPIAETYREQLRNFLRSFYEEGFLDIKNPGAVKGVSSIEDWPILRHFVAYIEALLIGEVISDIGAQALVEIMRLSYTEGLVDGKRIESGKVRKQ